MDLIGPQCRGTVTGDPYSSICVGIDLVVKELPTTLAILEDTTDNLTDTTMFSWVIYAMLITTIQGMLNTILYY